jgi:MoaA/NifB/PqqE/SkfB family radical SAM enzyme
MHIEPTSRCTLACPACPRTWFSETFNRPFPKQDLDVDALEKFLDCQSGTQVTEFILNGNHGDPIYYPDLFKLISRFRSSKTLKISTNGSYQKPEFWNKLSSLLTPNDTVYFSIDGLEHNNHLYRRNSDWNSIMEGLSILAQGPSRVVWKTLYFSYNINDIDQIKALAHSKGVEFFVEPSSRYGDEALQPNENFIDTSRLYKHNISTIDIEPQCGNPAEYISADGYYWPCCMITSMYSLHKTSLWKDRDNWKISNQTLDSAREQVLRWRQAILDNPADAHDVCKMSCKPGQGNGGWSNF